MRKCNACGKGIILRENNRYEVATRPTGSNLPTQSPVYYNVFNCPYCGCQNIEKEVVNDPVKMVTNAKEAEEYRIITTNDAKNYDFQRLKELIKILSDQEQTERGNKMKKTAELP